MVFVLQVATSTLDKFDFLMEVHLIIYLLQLLRLFIPSPPCQIRKNLLESNCGWYRKRGAGHISSIPSIFSKQLASDWQQLTSLEGQLGQEVKNYIWYSNRVDVLSLQR